MVTAYPVHAVYTYKV